MRNFLHLRKPVKPSSIQETSTINTVISGGTGSPSCPILQYAIEEHMREVMAFNQRSEQTYFGMVSGYRLHAAMP